MGSVRSRWESGNLVFYNNGGAGAVQVGRFVSAAVGSGMILSTSRTAAFRVCADDGGAALTAGAYRAAAARMLLTVACAAGDISVYGHQSQLKVIGDYSLATGILGGQWGYLELASGGNVNVAGALVGHIDVPTGATVTAHGAALLLKSNDLGGTHTGTIAGIYVPNPGAGTFDALLDLGAATGMTQDSAVGSTPGKHVVLYIGGVKHSWPTVKV